MPGQPKMVSIRIEPPSSVETCRPSSVTIGSSAFGGT